MLKLELDFIKSLANVMKEIVDPAVNDEGDILLSTGDMDLVFTKEKKFEGLSVNFFGKDLVIMNDLVVVMTDSDTEEFYEIDEDGEFAKDVMEYLNYRFKILEKYEI